MSTAPAPFFSPNHNDHMTTIHHLHLTRDRDGSVNVHNQAPQQDWLGYWATLCGTTVSINADAFAAALLAPYIERVGYDKPLKISITIQEEQ